MTLDRTVTPDRAVAPDNTVTRGTTLVAGVLGVTGRAVARYLVDQGLPAVGMSRRRPEIDFGIDHLVLDLTNPPPTAEVRDRLANVTHLVFAAYIADDDPRTAVTLNVQLLESALDLLAGAGAPLRHVTLYQGMKYYGAHLGNFKTPALEHDPRIFGTNFYYDQEDVLRARAGREGWDFTILRPEGVCGVAFGNPMNLLTVIGAYAALCAEMRVPLRFPGSLHAYDSLYQVTDARLLAKATIWAGDTTAAAGEAFNITNGDTLRWRHLFPAFASYWNLELAPPQPLSLTEQMRGMDPIWDRLVAGSGLVPTLFGQLAGWEFGDAIFNSRGDNVSSTIKIRHAGFADCIDTGQMFIELFDELIAQRYLPKTSSSQEVTS